MFGLRVLFLTVLVALVSARVSGAASIVCSPVKPCSIQWNANTELDLKEYRLYISQATGTYGIVPKLVIPISTTHTSSIGLGLLSDGPYFVTLTAVDLAGNESGRSNEVSFVYNGPPVAPVVTITVTVP